MACKGGKGCECDCGGSAAGAGTAVLAQDLAVFTGAKTPPQSEPVFTRSGVLLNRTATPLGGVGATGSELWCRCRCTCESTVLERSEGTPQATRPPDTRAGEAALAADAPPTVAFAPSPVLPLPGHWVFAPLGPSLAGTAVLGGTLPMSGIYSLRRGGGGGGAFAVVAPDSIQVPRWGRAPEKRWDRFGTMRETLEETTGTVQPIGGPPDTVTAGGPAIGPAPPPSTVSLENYPPDAGRSVHPSSLGDRLRKKVAGCPSCVLPAGAAPRRIADRTIPTSGSAPAGGIGTEWVILGGLPGRGPHGSGRSAAPGTLIVASGARTGWERPAGPYLRRGRTVAPPSTGMGPGSNPDLGPGGGVRPLGLLPGVDGSPGSKEAQRRSVRRPGDAQPGLLEPVPRPPSWRTPPSGPALPAGLPAGVVEDPGLGDPFVLSPPGVMPDGVTLGPGSSKALGPPVWDRGLGGKEVSPGDGAGASPMVMMPGASQGGLRSIPGSGSRSVKEAAFGALGRAARQQVGGGRGGGGVESLAARMDAAALRARELERRGPEGLGIPEAVWRSLYGEAVAEFNALLGAFKEKKRGGNLGKTLEDVLRRERDRAREAARLQDRAQARRQRSAERRAYSRMRTLAGVSRSRERAALRALGLEKARGATEKARETRSTLRALRNRFLSLRRKPVHGRTEGERRRRLAEVRKREEARVTAASVALGNARDRAKEMKEAGVPDFEVAVFELEVVGQADAALARARERTEELAAGLPGFVKRFEEALEGAEAATKGFEDASRRYEKLLENGAPEEATGKALEDLKAAEEDLGDAAQEVFERYQDLYDLTEPEPDAVKAPEGQPPEKEEGEDGEAEGGYRETVSGRIFPPLVCVHGDPPVCGSSACKPCEPGEVCLECHWERVPPPPPDIAGGSPGSGVGEPAAAQALQEEAYAAMDRSPAENWFDLHKVPVRTPGDGGASGKGFSERAVAPYGSRSGPVSYRKSPNRSPAAFLVTGLLPPTVFPQGAMAFFPAPKGGGGGPPPVAPPDSGGAAPPAPTKPPVSRGRGFFTKQLEPLTYDPDIARMGGNPPEWDGVRGERALRPGDGDSPRERPLIGAVLRKVLGAFMGNDAPEWVKDIAFDRMIRDLVFMGSDAPEWVENIAFNQTMRDLGEAGLALGNVQKYAFDQISDGLLLLDEYAHRANDVLDRAVGGAFDFTAAAFLEGAAQAAWTFNPELGEDLRRYSEALRDISLQQFALIDEAVRGERKPGEQVSGKRVGDFLARMGVAAFQGSVSSLAKALSRNLKGILVEGGVLPRELGEELIATLDEFARAGGEEASRSVADAWKALSTTADITEGMSEDEKWKHTLLRELLNPVNWLSGKLTLAAVDKFKRMLNARRLAKLKPCTPCESPRPANAPAPGSTPPRTPDGTSETAGKGSRLPEGVKPKYPPNDGFHGPPEWKTLKPGEKFIRWGGDGKFGAPEGTLPEGISIPPDRVGAPVHTYEVVKPVLVEAGPAEPWFGQPGMDTQYKFSTRILTLRDRGYLIEVK